MQYLVYLKLTPIKAPSRKPTIILNREVFVNLGAVKSDYIMAQGNSHLGLRMSAEEYKVRSPGIPFVIPPHPGI